VAAYEVLLLNTAIPQIQAAQSGDTYVVPRDIAFSAALTLSAGTANGVPYLNGSKVVTTGSALTFDGTVVNNTGLAPNIRATLTGGTVYTSLASDGVYATGTDLYLLAPAGKFISFYADNAEKMRLSGAAGGVGALGIGYTSLTSVGDSGLAVLGNVGIGTNAPTTKLYVTASVASTAIAAFFNTDTANGNGVYIKAGGANAGKYALAVDNAASASLLYLESSGNLGLGGSAARATTAGAAILNIFNGTAPVGTLTNGISLYSSSGEAYVMDAAGNATLFSPHDSETNEWIFKSKHTPSGKVLKIDVEKMLRFINDHFGLDAIHEFTEE
jgi:hypothetical protein